MFMVQYLCHSEMFLSSFYLMVRCCFIYSFTHSCQAVFSATLRATWPSHLLLLHGAGAPVKLQCCAATQAHTQSNTNIPTQVIKQSEETSWK